MVLTIAVLPRLGIGGLKLMRSEAPGPTLEKLTPRVTGTAKILWLVYLGLTVVAAALLLAAVNFSLYFLLDLPRTPCQAAR